MNLSVTVDGSAAQNEQHGADNYVNGACKPSIPRLHRSVVAAYRISIRFENAEHCFFVSQEG